MANLGNVIVAANLSTTLPGVLQSSLLRQSFEFNVVENGEDVMNNSSFPPHYIEKVVAPPVSQESGSLFGVIFSQKYFWQIDNIMTGTNPSDGFSSHDILQWTALGGTRDDYDISNNASMFPAAVVDLLTDDMDDPPIGTYDYGTNFEGPMWTNLPAPRDDKFLQDGGFGDPFTIDGTSDTQLTVSGPFTNGPPDPGIDFGGGSSVPDKPCLPNVLTQNTYVINQFNVFADIWWGVNAVLNLDVGIPFWVDIQRSNGKQDRQANFIAIRLVTNGGTSVKSNLTFFFPDNGSPIIYDHDVGDPLNLASQYTLEPVPQTMTGAPPLSGDLRVGFLPSCGRLIIFYAGSSFVYSRPNYTLAADSTGTSSVTPAASDFGVVPLVVQVDEINIVGTNSQAQVGVHPMVFAQGRAGLPIWAYETANGFTGEYFPMDRIPISNTPVTNSTTSDKYQGLGVSATMIGYDYSDTPETEDLIPAWQSNADPALTGYVGLGQVHFELEQDNAPTAAGTGTDTSAIPKNFYTATLTPYNADLSSNNSDSDGVYSTFLDGGEILPCQPSFIQRLRGQADVDGGYSFSYNASIPMTNMAADILAINESMSTPDRFHVVHSVDITLYNNNGQYNDLLNYCYGINLGMEWEAMLEGNNSPSVSIGFVGATYGGSASFIPGKETVTIHCEDYMAILGHTRIINSPYYDGMDSFDAILDLGKRAGITNIVDNTTDTSRYYLPAGYSFTQPRIHFSGEQSIKDALIDICKLCECYVYFDNTGTLVFQDLPGGLFGTAVDPTTIPQALQFTRDPSQPINQVILDELKPEYKLESAVNQVLLSSFDRASGSRILISTIAADPSTNRFPYRKLMFVQSPALGSYKAARLYSQYLQGRVYKVPRTVNFKVAASSAVVPGVIILVEGLQYRIMSINRSFNADDNSLITTISAEWFGNDPSGNNGSGSSGS